MFTKTKRITIEQYGKKEKLTLKLYVPRKKNQRHTHKWKHSWLSLKEICKLEEVDYPTVKFYRSKRLGVRKAIKMAKLNLHRQKKYEYEGKIYNQTQLARVLADKVGIKAGGMRNRLKSGLSIEQCLRGFREVELSKGRQLKFKFN